MGDTPLPQSQLDEWWDFADPAASFERFERAIDATADPGQRAEIRTQQARALGLQNRFAEAAGLLDAIETRGAPTAAARVRCLLEQGRVANSAGHPQDALPSFRAAAEAAEQHDLAFLGVDAWHMIAIADPEAAEQATAKGLELAAGSDDPRTQRWQVSLHNNAAWRLHDAGQPQEALASFEAAREAAHVVGTPTQRHDATWAVARCLRTLGRTAEALDLQRRLANDDPYDPDVQEEIAILESARPSAD